MPFRWFQRFFALMVLSFRLAGAEESGRAGLSFRGLPVSVEWTLPAEVPGLAAAVTGEVRRLELLFSSAEEGGVGRLNAAAGREPAEAPAELFELLVRAKEVARITSGAWDPAQGALTRLWNFAPGAHPVVPSPEAVRVALRRTGMFRVELDPRTRAVRLPEEMALDLDPVAAGYAADRVVELLRGAGASSVRADLDWVVKLWSAEPGLHRDFSVTDERRAAQVLARVRVENRAAAFAGDTQRVIERDGVRFHHILDPRSGLPAAGCRRVIVLCPRAEFAQCLSRALMTLHPEDAIRFMAKIPDADALVVANDGRVLMTPRLAAAQPPGAE